MLWKSYLDVITDGGLAVSDSDYYKAKLTEMIATEEVKEDVLDEILQTARCENVPRNSST